MVGHLSAVQPGERLRLRGTWKAHAKFGEQFEVESFVTLAPNTLDGIERYLGSGMVRGLGKVMAHRLVEKFGLDTLDVIDRQGDRLSEVEGIGPKRRGRILAAWSEHRGISEIMVFLQSHGISSAYAARIFRRYGARSAEVVRQDPYRLALEVPGIGFRMADDIARHLGIAADSPRRVMAGVLYFLERESESGHLYTLHPQVIEQSGVLLDIPSQPVEEAVATLEGDRQIVIDDEPEGRLVALPEYWDAEMAAAHRLTELLAQRGSVSSVERDSTVAAEVDAFEQANGLQLAPEQRKAVECSLREPLLLITGGPGTGKTTVVNAVISLLETRGKRVELAAPTGRASRRLEEATGRSARTLHRLLEYSPRDGAFVRNAQFPIECDVLILDEVSMIDALLFRAVLEALPKNASLVLVGDRDQLPSVGPGQVLADILASRAVPCVTLTEIFRQSRESLIVLNAHRVQRGELPELTQHVDEGGDFFHIDRSDPDEIADLVVEMVAERIPRRFGLDPRRDVQVLSPMRRGRLGVRALNERLQEKLNPDGVPCDEQRRLRLGDRVTQLRNNYDLHVYNGDIGVVTKVDSDEDRVTITFEDREVAYSARDIDDVALAYATSIHKSQGSEFPAVVIPFHTEHFVMLQRNLLYTAITRGRQLVVVIGSKRALEIGVRTSDGDVRRTRLARLLGA